VNYYIIDSFQPDTSGGLVQHYLQNVLGLQYLLADKDLFSRVMQESTNTSDVAYEAVCLLSSVHLHKLQPRLQGDEIEIRQRRLLPILNKHTYAAGDVMAALHVISSFLFLGGSGPWADWLNVAYIFIDSIFLRNIQTPVADILISCDEHCRYIIKTAMWFDVLASACLLQTPHFLAQYRQLFRPPSAHIDNKPPAVPPRLSMLSVMGCENHVVWAMAEVTHLLVWKNREQSRGCLSMPSLVDRGMQIEKHILPRPGAPLPPRSDSLDYDRYVTSDVFRASTRVYLHSVISGSHPSCPEIIEGIDDTLRCLERVEACSTSRSVVRSVVFSIYLCGCLTDDERKRQTFLKHLETQEVENVGNSFDVKILMTQVWDDRKKHRFEEPVRWQEFLRRSSILLV